MQAGGKMKKAFVSWSGGKDCCLAAYRAQQMGYKLAYLVNMVTQDGQRSCSHGMASRWVKLQSEAMGIPIVQNPTTGDNYEEVFTRTLKKLREEGVETGIFGDIDFNAHKEWIDRVCGNAGVTPVLPLWLQNQNDLARNFINLGFKTVIVATRSDLLGQDWLGRIFDASFLKDLAAFNKDITPCGEAGEFHSLVIDGPLFKKRMEIRETEKVQRENHYFLDIKKVDLVKK
jgi:diphthine-ammonia ligase